MLDQVSLCGDRQQIIAKELILALVGPMIMLPRNVNVA